MMTSEKTVLCELAQRLKQEGFADVRFYIERTERVGVGVLDGKRDSATRAKESAYFVEAGKDGKRHLLQHPGWNGRCGRADADFRLCLSGGLPAAAGL